MVKKKGRDLQDSEGASCDGESCERLHPPLFFQAGVLRNGGEKGVRRPQSMAEGEKRRTKKKKKSELGGYGVPFFPLLFSSLLLAPRPNTHGLEKGRAQN